MRWDAFIGPSYTARSLNASVERSVNLYTEKQESPNADPSTVLYGTPGTTTIFSVGAFVHRAQFSQNGRSFALVGALFYETTTGAGVLLASGLADDGKLASICSNGEGGNQLFIVSGGSGYLFTLNTNVFSTITDADFPTGNARCGVFLDGYFVVLTTSGIFFAISDLEDGTTWSALDRAQSSISSDLWQYMTVIGRNLLLVGSQTSQIWYNSGAADFPFSPIPGLLINQGTSAPWSLAPFESSAAWLSQNPDGGRMVMLAEGATVKRISTHAVETAINAYALVDDFEAWTYQEAGHAFYVLRSLRNQATWVYDASTDLWHERGWWNTTTGEYEVIRGRTHAYVNGQHWIGDYATGAMYRQGLDLYSDAGGVPLRALRRTPHLTNELKRVFYQLFQIDMQVGVGLVTGQGSDPQMMLRLSRDGGYTWGNEQWRTCGAMGTYNTHVKWAPLGAGRNVVFEVVQTDPVKRAWVSAFLETRAGLT